MLLSIGAVLAMDVWGGTGVSTGVIADQGWGAAPSQVELDLRFTGESVGLRLDIDVHLDPNTGTVVTPWVPEEAHLSLAGERFGVLLGVVNPAIGLQVWDEWGNYLPTYSNSWAFQPAQVVGAIPSLTVAEGSDVFLWGGYDPVWAAPTVGGGFASEQDGYGTWSGVFVYPGLDCGGSAGTYMGAVASFEAYLSDAVTIAVDGTGGLACGSGFASGQLIGNLLPSAVISPSVRVEGTMDGDGFLTGNTWAVGAGARAYPVEWLWVGTELKQQFAGGEGHPVFALMAGVFPPEPE